MRHLCLLLTLLMLVPAAKAADFHDTSAGKVLVEPIVTKLNRPWAVAFLPDGGLLITERDVRKIQHVSSEGRISEVGGLPEISRTGQGGLLDLVLAKDFGTTRELFLSFAEPDGLGQRTALAVARLSGDASRLHEFRVIFRLNVATDSGSHFGGRIVEDSTGALFMTVGDRARSALAQDPKMHNGKVIRVNRDGSIPADNPFAKGPLLPEIWSMGHRNPQGAALDTKGRLWTVSHGAAGGDEVNQPRPGRNYGWPVISYGTHYSGASIGIGTSASGMEQPKHYWDPSIAPSGMMIYSGKLFPAWKDSIFVGSLKFDHISRLDRSDDRITAEERLFNGDYERIRDIREAPDGSIWFLSVGDRTLYRASPAR
jgi:glucose/arabinose dehydrogenase